MEANQKQVTISLSSKSGKQQRLANGPKQKDWETLYVSSFRRHPWKRIPNNHSRRRYPWIFLSNEDLAKDLATPMLPYQHILTLRIPTVATELSRTHLDFVEAPPNRWLLPVTSKYQIYRKPPNQHQLAQASKKRLTGWRVDGECANVKNKKWEHFCTRLKSLESL